ncbi:MAG: cytochrome c biogenesis heme-transporting ATPase CcmA [Zoogloeaceae bacterium]|jgi:heme exporter protein A|nr:cytochrome c biogenesis heme-transporting ATPase CcmA [Zoogloeaceae bacterium]
MLEVIDLEGQRGDSCLFHGVNFCLEAGELLLLRGRNGAGKTTLLRALCGLTPPASGKICWKGEPIHAQGAEYRRELCYLGHANAIKEDFTPLENFRAQACLSGDAEHPETKDALAALGELGLSGREHLVCRHLSQGQKRRTALSRLARERRALWILDEPFVALDAQAVAWLSGRLGEHLASGGLVVLTSHQSADIPRARKIKTLTLSA